MTERFALERSGTRLAYAEFGGNGPPAVLLHGAGKHAGEWRDTASWLVENYRVVGLDQRGHGRSERFPAELFRDAYVDDAAALVDHLNDGPAVVIGHSMGGQIGFLLAARYPELVFALVLAEVTPSRDGRAHEAMREWLRSWPLPFASRDEAAIFFGGPPLRRQAWVDGLERRDDGWWPRFDLLVIDAALAEIASESCWHEWRDVRCPTLIVHGAQGLVWSHDTTLMRNQHTGSQVVEIPDAGHEVPLEQPLRWRHAVASFLADVDPEASPTYRSSP
jgi:pimeloyl-ACP methyl ester carboxylesterase